MFQTILLQTRYKHVFFSKVFTTPASCYACLPCVYCDRTNNCVAFTINVPYPLSLGHERVKLQHIHY